MQVSSSHLSVSVLLSCLLCSPACAGAGTVVSVGTQCFSDLLDRVFV